MKTAERDSARKQIEKARADLAIRKEQEELALAQAEATMRKAALKLEAPLEVQKGGLNERKQISSSTTSHGPRPITGKSASRPSQRLRGSRSRC